MCITWQHFDAKIKCKSGRALQKISRFKEARNCRFSSVFFLVVAVVYLLIKSDHNRVRGHQKGPHTRHSVVEASAKSHFKRDFRGKLSKETINGEVQYKSLHLV